MKAGLFRREFTDILAYGLTVLAWVAYQSLGRPKVGLIVLLFYVCIVSTKKIWNDVSTAIWLRRMDWNEYRGKAHFFFYNASAFCTLSISSSVVFFLVTEPWIKFEAAFPSLVSFALFFLVSVLSFVNAISFAHRGRIKVCYNKDIHSDRKRNRWPPSQTVETYVGFLLFYFVFLVFAPAALGMMALGSHIDSMVGNSFLLGLTVSMIAGFGAILGSFMIGKYLLLILKSRYFISPNSDECWGEAPDAAWSRRK